MGKKGQVGFSWRGRHYRVLSWTTGMECWSFSLPAVQSCPGMIARDEKDVCWYCYAQIGRYAGLKVMQSQAARYAWVRHWPEQEVEDRIVAAIECEYDEGGYFRLHDSGDFFSVRYAKMWHRIAARVPTVKIWTTTRSWGHSAAHLRIADALKELNGLPNVTIRPSAIEMDTAPPIVDGFAAGAGVASAGREGATCPKSINHTSCEAERCRRCWDRSQDPVVFALHGRSGVPVHASDANRHKRKLVVLGETP